MLLPGFNRAHRVQPTREIPAIRMTVNLLFMALSSVVVPHWMAVQAKARETEIRLPDGGLIFF